jgi:predicted HicB family RNase H-like nuclease
MADMKTAARTERRPFSARVTLREDPAILEALERRAARAGHSISDEIRAAVRRALETRAGR